MSDFVKVCPKCKSSNIKQHLPQLNDSWICLTCGNRGFMPVEIMNKYLGEI